MMHTTRFVSPQMVRVATLILCLVLVAGFGRLSPALKVAAASSPAQGDPRAVSGEWSQAQALGFIPIHVHVLPNGKVLMWGRHILFFKGGGEADANMFSQTYIFDPASDTITAAPFNSTTNLFCSGHCFLPDGRLLITGGHHGDDAKGEPHANLFDYVTNTYSLGPDMNAGRWYPTTCALGNGEALVMSGVDVNGQLNQLPQVFQTN